MRMERTGREEKGGVGMFSFEGFITKQNCGDTTLVISEYKYWYLSLGRYSKIIIDWGA